MLSFQHGVAWGLRSFILVGVQLLFLSGAMIITSYPCSAAPPIPYGGWANQGGNIRARCPAGFTCTDNVSSTNMLQRIITDNSSGDSYVQVIIDDTNRAAGTYRSETFVNASNADGIPIPLVDPEDPTKTPGIDPVVIPGNELNTENRMQSQNSGAATQMTIQQTGVNATSFDYSYSVNSGWAVSPNEPTIDLDFRVKDRTARGIDADYGFTLQQRTNARGQITGRIYGIDQLVKNSAVISSGNGGGRDDSKFVLRRAWGDYVSAGQASLPPPAGGMGGMGGGTAPNPSDPNGAPPFGILPNPQNTPFPNPPGAPTGNPAGMGGGGTAPPGGSVAWNTGNEVQVIWIGQVCPGCAIAGMGGMGGANGIFSFQQYENVTRGTSAATRSIMGSAPFTWNDPPFGPRPSGL